MPRRACLLTRRGTTIHYLLPLLIVEIAAMAYGVADRGHRIKDRWAKILIQLESIHAILRQRKSNIGSDDTN